MATDDTTDCTRGREILCGSGTGLPADDGAWFDEAGMLCREIPDECVDAVAQSGDNGPAVKEWAEKLEFGKGLDQDWARGHVFESGAYSLLEVVSMTDEAVAEWMLWQACWDIRDADSREDAAYGMCDSRRLSVFLKDHVCKNWGYENGFDALAEKAFKEAEAIHAKLVERHPDKHKITATDTIRGDHHRYCTCGFTYAWDSSD